MKPTLQLAILAVVMIVLMSGGWLWQRKHRNACIVDVIWSGGMGVGAVLMAVTGAGAFTPRLALGLLGGTWAARLALHIWRRLAKETREDGRYHHLREHWNGHQGKFYAMFQFQTGLVLLFSLPFVAVAANPVDDVTPLLMAGVATWIIAVAGEAVADGQLARFRADPSNHGKTCRAGLWRYSRHPNYFFEWLHWFAYVALAQGSGLAWLSWSGPIVMYVFLRWISGIPYTEAQALRSRGDDYRNYQQQTSMLIPWFPKSPPSPISQNSQNSQNSQHSQKSTKQGTHHG
jgi:steroid 5-alpha reductase family enzyme